MISYSMLRITRSDKYGKKWGQLIFFLFQNLLSNIIKVDITRYGGPKLV